MEAYIKMQAKQSVRRVYALSAKAKDVREVVTRLNLCRQQRDCARDAAVLEAAACAWQAGLDKEQHTAANPSSVPRSTRAWDVFLQASLCCWCIRVSTATPCFTQTHVGGLKAKEDIAAGESRPGTVSQGARG